MKQNTKVLTCIDVNNNGRQKVLLRATHMTELVVQKTKVLERAAKTVQRPIHASMRREEFLLLRKVAIDIQSLCRGKNLIIRHNFNFSQAFICKNNATILVYPLPTSLYPQQECVSL
jgi:hypothetical protein